MQQNYFQTLKTRAKTATANTPGAVYSKVRKSMILALHRDLSAVGIPRRRAGGKLGLRKRMQIAEAIGG